MKRHWALVRCTCGSAYGLARGATRSCPHCGSSQGSESKFFESPDELSQAVAKSNLPEAIAQEVESKIDSQQAKSQSKATMSRGGPEAIRRIMRQSTSSDGTLTIESLSHELRKYGYEEPSAEQLIGSAEAEGKLIRKSPKSWVWL
ncbi:MAG: hypothetical protein VX204_03265 [Candidatus Thermoplasmatota archaeon]|nr:hypothetical protein [Candidatus Thermoplasmatota archaeon]